MRIANTTRGILCIDPPNEHVESGDPVADLLSSVDLSKPATTDDALRLLVGLEVAKRQSAQIERTRMVAAERRAKHTIDLLPEYQGEDRPKHVNDVPDDVWRKLERMPVIAARIATGDLRVVSYPAVGAPF